MRARENCRRGPSIVLPSWLAACLLLPVLADDRSQIHAVIGEPLSAAIPLSFAGAGPGYVRVRISPAPGLPQAEEEAAESVRAAYDPDRGAVLLRSSERLKVPVLSLHLEVATDTATLKRELDVLVDLPDLGTQRAPQPQGGAPAAAAGLRVFAIHRDEPPPERFGDPQTGAPDEDTGGRPLATPLLPPPAPDTRPRSYRVRSGDTLDGIARRLASAWGVAPAPMALSLYEANLDAFAAASPARPLPLPIVGRRLLVPDAAAVDGEPAGRVAAFGRWLRHPAQPWRLLALPGSPQPAPPSGQRRARADFAQGLAVAAGLMLLFGAGLLVLRRLRLHRLLRHYVPMSAVKRYAPAPSAVKRIILPAPVPPPRRGLMNSPAAEKMRIKRLRDMLDEHPFRSDIRYRLAQRLYRTGDARGFAQVAPALRPALAPEAWGRICAMGRELLPGDPRFARAEPLRDLQPAVGGAVRGRAKPA